MSDRYILNAKGEPKAEPDLLTWGRWFETAERRIGAAQLPGVCVSTVFLGLDHRFFGAGAPVLWETMIFGGPHGGAQWRYDSRENALEGHVEAVELAETTYYAHLLLAHSRGLKGARRWCVENKLART